MNGDKKKVAVVMMNFGGPDKLSSVQQFLFNLFYDKRIIRLPRLFRWILAKFISKVRRKKSENIYQQMGGGSPILHETVLQCEDVKRRFASNDAIDVEIFIAMRYWYPRAQDIQSEVLRYNPELIILLPMYPHFSTTTTLSSIDDWENATQSNALSRLPCVAVPSHYSHHSFVSAHVDILLKAMRDAEIVSAMDSQRKVCIIFSAHSLPQKIVDDGDVYQQHIIKSVSLIMLQLAKISGREFTHVISYQSKVGKMKWLEPSSEEVIQKMADAGFGLIVVPISFVSENSETLVELDIDYAKLAQNAPFYIRVPALGLNKWYMHCLYDIISSIIDLSVI